MTSGRVQTSGIIINTVMFLKQIKEFILKSLNSNIYSVTLLKIDCPLPMTSQPDVVTCRSTGLVIGWLDVQK